MTIKATMYEVHADISVLRARTSFTYIVPADCIYATIAEFPFVTTCIFGYTQVTAKNYMTTTQAGRLHVFIKCVHSSTSNCRSNRSTSHTLVYIIGSTYIELVVIRMRMPRYNSCGTHYMMCIYIMQ
jgi:hypothetical protein